jgi:hypothetical protein
MPSKPWYFGRGGIYRVDDDPVQIIIVVVLLQVLGKISVEPLFALRCTCNSRGGEVAAKLDIVTVDGVLLDPRDDWNPDMAIVDATWHLLD